MNKFLLSASERFDKLKGDKDFLINPLSKTDCEIFIELMQIIKKAGLEEVIAIARSFKEYKDEEIRDNLLQYNIDNPTISTKKSVTRDIVGDSPNDEQPFPSFFKLGYFMLHEFSIKGYKRVERFDEESQDMVYGIILNPVPEGFSVKSIPMYANERIEFTSEENRNKVLGNLSEYLSSRDIQIVDLNEDE